MYTDTHTRTAGTNTAKRTSHTCFERISSISPPLALRSERFDSVNTSRLLAVRFNVLEFMVYAVYHTRKTESRTQTMSGTANKWKNEKQTRYMRVYVCVSMVSLVSATCISTAQCFLFCSTRFSSAVASFCCLHTESSYMLPSVKGKCGFQCNAFAHNMSCCRSRARSHSHLLSGRSGVQPMLRARFHFGRKKRVAMDTSAQSQYFGRTLHKASAREVRLGCEVRLGGLIGNIA